MPSAMTRLVMRRTSPMAKLGSDYGGYRREYAPLVSDAVKDLLGIVRLVA